MSAYESIRAVHEEILSELGYEEIDLSEKELKIFPYSLLSTYGIFRIHEHPTHGDTHELLIVYAGRIYKSPHWEIQDIVHDYSKF